MAAQNGHVNPDFYFLDNIQFDDKVVNLLFLEPEGFNAKDIVAMNDAQILNHQYKEASTLLPQQVLECHWGNRVNKEIKFSLEI